MRWGDVPQATLTARGLRHQLSSTITRPASSRHQFAPNEFTKQIAFERGSGNVLRQNDWPVGFSFAQQEHTWKRNRNWLATTFPPTPPRGAVPAPTKTFYDTPRLADFRTTGPSTTNPSKLLTTTPGGRLSPRNRSLCHEDRVPYDPDGRKKIASTNARLER